MSEKPYDQASRYLAEQDPEALLSLLKCINPKHKAQIKVLSREISISAKISDLPYLVITKGKQKIVLIEMQTVYDYAIAERIMEYVIRLWFFYKIPTIEVYVLLLTDKGMPRGKLKPWAMKLGPVSIKVNYQSVLVKAWELDAKEALAMGRPSLLPLVPLLKGDRQELITAAQRLAEMEDRTSHEEMALHFFMLAGLRYNPREVLEIMRGAEMIPIEQLRESSTYQYILQEGLREGEQKGKLEESRNTLLKLIAKRFPTLDLRSEIEHINDLSILEDLCLKVIDASNADEMKNSVLALANPK